MTPLAGGCEGVTGLELSTQQRDPPQDWCRRHLPSPRLADPPRRRRPGRATRDLIEGRRYLGLDVIAWSRTPVDDQHTEEVKDPMTPAGLTAQSATTGSWGDRFTHHDRGLGHDQSASVMQDAWMRRILRAGGSGTLAPHGHVRLTPGCVGFRAQGGTYEDPRPEHPTSHLQARSHR
jgi:hypothetical protein